MARAPSEFGLDAPVSHASDTSEPYREAVLKVLSIFVDSQLAAAANFNDAMHTCPSIHDRVTAARVVLDKTANAEKFIPVMHEFGAATDKYLVHHPWAARHERVAPLDTAMVGRRDMRNPVFDFPLLNWKDAIVWAVLVGQSSNLQITDFCEMSYQPGAGVFQEIQPVEHHHHGLALEEFQKYAAVPENRQPLQTSIDYWWPRVSAGFGKNGSKTSQILEIFGLRRMSNAALRAQWVSDMEGLVTEFGLLPRESVTEFKGAPEDDKDQSPAAYR
jgi:1,2-phenylacetyl-CoA epoxidase catalytic subunit